MKFLQKLSSKKLIAIILIVGFLVYLNALSNSFVWDDEEQVVNNLLIRSWVNFPQIFGGSTFQTGGTGGLSGMYYKPLMTLSFMFNYSIWKLNAFGYHLFQIVFHLTNAVLVFLLLQKLFNNAKLKQGYVWAFWASLIFVAHPANVEAVVYVSAAQDVLVAFFGLLALNFLFRRFKKSWIEVTILSGFLLLSLLSKESGIAVIPVGIILSFWFLKEKLKPWLLAGFSAFFGYCFLRFILARVFVSTSSVIPIVKASFGERLLTFPYELFSYFRIFFFPKDLFISQHLVIREISDHRFWLYLPLVFVSLGILAFFAWRKKTKLFAFFFLWYFFSISLVLNLFPLDMTVAERWLYFPMVGLLGMMVVILGWVSERWASAKKIVPYALLVAVFLLASRSIIRCGDWRNGFRLYSHDAKLVPDSFDLQNNLGVEYFRQDDFQKAELHFGRSIELEPDWWTPYNNLGVIYERKGELKEARRLYEKAIENGNYYLAHENLAFIVLREEEPKRAVEIIEKSVAVLPYNFRILTTLALAYYKDGQYAEAEKLARRLFSLNPSRQNLNLLEAITKRQPIEF